MAALLLVLLSLFLPPGSAPERTHVVVLHTNDIHGQVLPRPATWLRDRDPAPMTGGLERLGAEIARLRKQLEAQGSHVLVVDGGDWYQGTPEGGLEGGRAFLEALATVGYDALCVGNHEFDHGVEHFAGLMEDLDLPAVLANVRNDQGEFLPGCPPYRIVEAGPLKVALVGLLTPSTPRMTPPDVRELEFELPSRTLRRLQKELEVDWILPLTHLGLDDDRALARSLPWLDLIVGGHSHTFLAEGRRQGDTLVVQAASKASCVGRVDLWFDAETKQLLESRADTVDLFIEDAPKAPKALARACEGLVERAGEVMDEVVGELSSALPRGRDAYRSSPSGNLVTDIMRWASGAQIGITNRGGLRANLDAGPVTRRELFDLLPFGNTLVKVELSGEQLQALVRRSIEGMGGSGLEYSGLQVELKRSGDSASLVALRIGGELLEPDKTYSVVTNSFLAQGGDAYIELVRAERKTHLPGALRDHMARYLTEAGKAVQPCQENRFLVR